jgi:hypothetical protein
MPAANMKKMRIISIPGLAKEAMLRLRVEKPPVARVAKA